MKTKLLTDFVCVATSGHTADKRNIEEQDLLDIAETYDREKYTANIWVEHYRFSNLGQVDEVKLEEVTDKDGVKRYKLYARLAPSVELLQYNKRGQGLFTSIEFTRDFAGTGKTYLTGLAVTDSPASLGTTQLHFSKRVDNGVMFGNSEKLNLNDAEPSEYGMLRRFFAWLGDHGEPAEKQNFAATNGTANNNMDVKDMDEKTLTALVTTAVTAAVSEAFKAQQPAPVTKAEQNEPAPQAPAPKAPEQAEPETVSAEEFKQLKEAFDGLSEQFKKAVSTERTETPSGLGASEHFKVDTAI